MHIPRPFVFRTTCHAPASGAGVAEAVDWRSNLDDNLGYERTRP